MKRIVTLVAGVIIICAVVSSTYRLAAQTPPPANTARPPLTTRIGLLNMVYVLKHYKKFLPAVFGPYGQFPSQNYCSRSRYPLL